MIRENQAPASQRYRIVNPKLPLLQAGWKIRSVKPTLKLFFETDSSPVFWGNGKPQVLKCFNHLLFRHGITLSKVSPITKPSCKVHQQHLCSLVATKTCGNHCDVNSVNPISLKIGGQFDYGKSMVFHF